MGRPEEEHGQIILPFAAASGPQEPRDVEALRKTYNSLDDIDLFAGGSLEQVRKKPKVIVNPFCSPTKTR